MSKDDDIWVFLSHSNKDYEKVIKVRNLLEQYSFRPLMFFLKCLDDEEEVDDLIKREIDSRGRFILCDSQNAQSSKWVQRETEYIKSKRRIYEVINIECPEEELVSEIVEFKKNSSVYVSHSLEDSSIYSQFTELLDVNWDFRINQYDIFISYCESDAGIAQSLIKILQEEAKKKIDQALDDGYVIFMLTKNYMKSELCLTELEYTFEKIAEHEHNVIVLKYGISDSEISSIVPKYNKSHALSFSVTNGKLSIDMTELYFKFMGDKIIKRAKGGDEIAQKWAEEYNQSISKDDNAPDRIGCSKDEL